MGWIVRVEGPADGRDLASSVLWDLNTTGIAELDADPAVSSDGRGRALLLAGFNTKRNAGRARDGMLATLSTLGNQRRGQPDWVVSIEPVDTAAWIDPDRRIDVELNGQRRSLEVGAAFGDGRHPSTELALRLLAEVSPLGKVLDFGAGTGILSLAAASYGASSVLAVEHDPAALAVAERNRDRYRDRFDRCPIELCGALGAAAEARFDVVLANLLLQVHREQGQTLGRALGSGGALIVSGFLAEQRAAVAQAYSGRHVTQTIEAGDWLGMILR